MALRYQKRINLGRGAGLNLSKSGVSASYRGRHGSIGTTGFSLRTGIPGVSFRQNWSKKSGPVVVILAMVLYGLVVLVWNVARLASYLIVRSYYFFTKQTNNEK